MILLQYIINQLIGGRVLDNLYIDRTEEEVGLISNGSMWDAVTNYAKAYDKKVKAVDRGGILFQKKETWRSDSEIETGLMVYVHYTDGSYDNLIVMIDGTIKVVKVDALD